MKDELQVNVADANWVLPPWFNVMTSDTATRQVGGNRRLIVETLQNCS